MNSEDEERLTALGLALNLPNQCNQRTLDDDPSAGANAGSCACMTFVAANPLSEIIWSPHKGLCLKCAVCSFPDRKHLLSSGLDSKNVVPLVPQTISQSANCSLQDINRNNLVGLEQSFKVKCDSNRSSTSNFPISRTGAVPLCLSPNENHTGTGGNILDMNTDADVSPSLRDPEVETLKNRETEDSSGIHNMQTGATLEAMEQPKPPLPGQNTERSGGVPKIETSLGDTNGECKNVASNNEGMGLGLQMIPFTEASPVNEVKVCHNPGFSPRRGSIRPASSVEEGIEKDITCNYGLPLVEKLESTDENDVPIGKSEIAGNVVSGSPVGNGGIIIKVSEIEAMGKHFPDSNSPTNARICKCHSKGKEKALSDSDINGRTLEDDDDSHESVESCNSAGLFSVGKKRLRFEQQWNVRSKRAKKIQDNPSSSSYPKQDSSFMNWISNMMKGFTRQNQDESCSLALALANPDVGHEHLDSTLNGDSKNIDYLHGEIGFKSIFQSIYCLSKNDQVAKTSFPSEQAREGSMEKEPSRCDINADTIMHTEEINATNEEMLKSNKVFGEFHLGNKAGPHKLPGSTYVKTNSSEDNHKMHSVGKMSSNNLEDGSDKGVVNISTSSFAEHELYKVENNSTSPSEDNINHLAYRGDPLKSLWIARFSAKSSSSLLRQDAFNIGRHGDLKDSNNCIKPSCVQLSSGLHKDRMTPEVKQNQHEEPSHVLVHELQNYVISNEASSFGLKRLEVSHDLGMIQTASHALSSQRLKSSEAMASTFARRLDALRNILPSEQADDAIKATTSCFFCGMKGHHLRNCCEITETEMEELLKKLNSHDSWGECLCIRCLQLNHWAVACPNMCPKLRQLDDHAPTSKPHNPLKDFTMGLARKEVSISENIFSRTNLIDKDKELVLGNQTDESEISPHNPMKDFTMGLARKEVSISENMFSRTNLIDKDKELVLGNQTDENEIRELSISPKGKSLDVPKGIFDAIKLLRLSRTDIFKWMNSQISLSQLDGFFLRLRLGKWEEGLGGTGYYVACISGMQKEKQMKDAKSPISVNVRGIKCVVESQYISNHEFLEDELMAWWSTTSQVDGKIPSEEELKSKVEERKMLGF